jgi:glucose dehydrogenase
VIAVQRTSKIHLPRTSKRVSRRTVLRGGIAAAALGIGNSAVWEGPVTASSRTAPATPVATAPPDGEWPAYGRDAGGMRHAPLTQIDRGNVGDLRVAWTYHTGELATYAGTNLADKAAFEATPLMVGGTLYLSTPTNRVIALDATTGAERWVFDPRVDRSSGYSEVTSRGVATWADDAGSRRV